MHVGVCCMTVQAPAIIKRILFGKLQSWMSVLASPSRGPDSSAPASCLLQMLVPETAPMESEGRKTPFFSEEQEHPESGHEEDRGSPERKRGPRNPQGKRARKEAEEDLGPHALSLVEKMKAAVACDNKSNKEQRPAVEKVTLLDSFYGKLINRKYQDALMDSGVLAAIRMWLEPLPDRSLPNIKIRRCMLEALMHMKVGVAHLEDSRVGEIVNFYSRSPREDKETRKLARALIQKWTKLVLLEERQ